MYFKMSVVKKKNKKNEVCLIDKSFSEVSGNILGGRNALSVKGSDSVSYSNYIANVDFT